MSHFSSIRVGLQGLDSFGLYQWQQLSLRSDFELTAFCASAEVDLPTPQSRAPVTRCDRLEELLKQDVALIVLAELAFDPNQVASLVCEVLQANKHVLLSRPIPFAPEEWKKIVAESAKTQKRVWMSFDGETDSDYRTAVEVISAGGLGELRSVRFLNFCQGVAVPEEGVQRAGLPEPRTERGLWPTEGLQGLGLLLSFMNRRVQRVYAASQRENEHLQILLEFEGGGRGHWEIDLALPASLSTGWYLQGREASYLRQKLYRVTEEGEVVEGGVVVQPSNPGVFYDLLAKEIRQAGEASDSPHRGLTELFAVYAAARAAAASEDWTKVPCGE